MANIIILKSSDSYSLRYQNSSAISAISSILSSCLGPNAMQKLILTKMNSLEMTNDGNSIIRELDIAHPAAKILVEISRTQDETVGDGTTSVIILASEIFSNVIKLDYHPVLMSNSLKKILDFVLKKTEEVRIELTDESKIYNIVSQSVATKLCTIFKLDIPKLALEAAKIAENISDIRLEKILDTEYKNSAVINGIALTKMIYHPQMRHKILNPRILIIENSIEYTKGASQTNIDIYKVEDFSRSLEIENEAVIEMINHIVSLKPDVVIVEKGISDIALSIFSKNNITAIRRLTKTESSRLAKAVGAKIVARAIDATESNLSTCGVFEYKKIGEQYFCIFDKCHNPKACSVFLRGPSKDILNEFERNFQDALKVSKNLLSKKYLVPGGGAFETFISNSLKEFKGPKMEEDIAKKISEAFKIIPEILIKNSGAEDPFSLVSELEVRNKQNNMLGFNSITGKIEDMSNIILESVLVKEQTIKSVIEAISLLLRVDGIIKSKN